MLWCDRYRPLYNCVVHREYSVVVDRATITRRSRHLVIGEGAIIHRQCARVVDATTSCGRTAVDGQITQDDSTPTRNCDNLHIFAAIIAGVTAELDRVPSAVDRQRFADGERTVEIDAVTAIKGDRTAATEIADRLTQRTRTAVVGVGNGHTL